MTPGTNQICFVSFISHIWHKPNFCKRIKRCKMVFWYLSHKDDTFVSKLSLESSIYFDHSGFSLEVFVMLKWSNSVFWCNKTTMPAIIFRLSQITNQTVPSLRWKVSKNLCQMWEHKHHKANLVTGTETDCCYTDSHFDQDFWSKTCHIQAVRLLCCFLRLWQNCVSRKPCY